MIKDRSGVYIYMRNVCYPMSVAICALYIDQSTKSLKADNDKMLNADPSTCRRRAIDLHFNPSTGLHPKHRKGANYVADVIYGQSIAFKVEVRGRPTI